MIQTFGVTVMCADSRNVVHSPLIWQDTSRGYRSLTGGGWKPGCTCGWRDRLYYGTKRGAWIESMMHCKKKQNA